jgi:hypothetical protein
LTDVNSPAVLPPSAALALADGVGTAIASSATSSSNPRHFRVPKFLNSERESARQLDATYANRLIGPGSGRATRSNLKRGATLLFNLLFRVGLLADYRRPFWRMAREALKRGQVESLFTIGFVSYHLIEFSREALRGDQNASFYSAQARETLKEMSSRSTGAVRRSA